MDFQDRGLPSIPHEWFERPGGRNAARSIHGASHTRRVWVHATELAHELGLSALERRALDLAARWHDIGRTHDGIDHAHGEKSARRVLGMGLHAGQDPLAVELALFAVWHHSVSDAHAEHEAGQLADPEPALRVLHVLKDADALDRVRLGSWDLDESYLRFEASRRRVDRAWELLEEMP